MEGVPGGTAMRRPQFALIDPADTSRRCDRERVSRSHGVHSGQRKGQRDLRFCGYRVTV